MIAIRAKIDIWPFCSKKLKAIQGITEIEKYSKYLSEFSFNEVNLKIFFELILPAFDISLFINQLEPSMSIENIHKVPDISKSLHLNSLLFFSQK